MVKRLQQLQIKLGGLDVAVAIVNTQSFATSEDIRWNQLRRQRAVVLANFSSNRAGDARKFVTIERHDIAATRSAWRLVGIDKCLEVLENAEFLQRLISSENHSILAVKLRKYFNALTHSFPSAHPEKFVRRRASCMPAECSQLSSDQGHWFWRSRLEPKNGLKNLNFNPHSRDLFLTLNLVKSTRAELLSLEL